MDDCPWNTGPSGPTQSFMSLGSIYEYQVKRDILLLDCCRCANVYATRSFQALGPRPIFLLVSVETCLKFTPFSFTYIKVEWRRRSWWLCTQFSWQTILTLTGKCILCNWLLSQSKPYSSVHQSRVIFNSIVLDCSYSLHIELLNEGQIREQTSTSDHYDTQAVPIVMCVSWADDQLRISGLWCLKLSIFCVETCQDQIWTRSQASLLESMQLKVLAKLEVT